MSYKVYFQSLSDCGVTWTTKFTYGALWWLVGELKRTKSAHCWLKRPPKTEGNEDEGRFVSKKNKEQRNECTVLNIWAVWP